MKQLILKIFHLASFFSFFFFFFLSSGDDDDDFSSFRLCHSLEHSNDSHKIEFTILLLTFYVLIIAVV